MIHTLHLLWIIPTAVCFGFFWAAVFAVGRVNDNERRIYDTGHKN